MSPTEVKVYSSPAEFPPKRRRRVPRWFLILIGGLVAAWILAVAAWNVKLDYFAFAPGPITEVEDLISVDGAVVDPESELYMLTVSIGSEPVNIYEWLGAMFDSSITLVKRDLVRPREVSYEEYREYNENLMDESVNLAKSVALDYLGHEVTFTGEGILVVDTLEDTPADGTLLPNDVIIAISGEPVQIASDGVALIQSYQPGDTIVLTVVRGDEELELPVTLVEHTSEPGMPMVGFLPDTVNLSYEFPVDVEIDTSAAIGPSAGLVYTLGVINALTPDVDELGGLIVAGTGTINGDGEVGAIGGIRQKVLAAQAAGADVIFVPAGNYEEALTAGATIPIVPVERFEDALAYAAANPAA